MPTSPEQQFREAVQHVRYDGAHIGEPSQEGWVNICGNVHIEQLEVVVAALRAYADATTYKPDKDAASAGGE